MLKKGSLFLASLLVVALAQPDISIWMCLFASTIGYALFWKSLETLDRKQKFFLSLVWFVLVQGYHLSWFTSDKYVGNLIFLFLALWLLIVGSFFSTLNAYLPLKNPFAFASIWTLFEWGRLFVSSGFSWDPIGLSMTATIYGMQIASLLGLFGLTFWVLMTNALFFKALTEKFNKIHYLKFALVAAFPYIFGICHVFYHENKLENSKRLNALLVQTALYPEEKNRISETISALHPLDQWNRIFSLLKEYETKKLDLIVLSEACVPYGTHFPIYPLQEAKDYFSFFFKKEPLSEKSFVDNAYMAHAIADHFNSELIVGLEDVEYKKGVRNVYNAGFLFHPETKSKDRYDKRVLVPLGEFIPFSFLKDFLKKYGIEDSFTKGKEAKVFESKQGRIGMSICYEETYGHIVRQSRKKGATLLVNLTNDAWYPRSRLPIVHYHHGKVRVVECGVPLLRACNTGVTCGVDSLGRLVNFLEYENKYDAPNAGALYLELPTYTYHTLYTFFGDLTIVLIACFWLMKKLLRDTFFAKTRES